MKVSEIMSPEPRTVSPEQTLVKAVGRMQRLDTGKLPIGEDDLLRGTLTDRDIAVRGPADRGPDAP